MVGADPDKDALTIASKALADGDATGWFERLYAAAEEGTAVVPWDRGAPHGLLVEWAEARMVQAAGRRALVVGCGLGEDAEYVAALGFSTVAFDVSATAVRAAQRRFPGTKVQYVTADLLDPPADGRERFDLVVESRTVQSLPVDLRADAIENVGRMVAPEGTLIVISAARGDGEDPPQGPPWPLTRAEVEAFGKGGIQATEVELVPDASNPEVRNWRAEFRRTASQR